MEQAADMAVARGDVAVAAHAYLQAACVAQVPADTLWRETLAWFDRYLGPVGTR